MLSVNLYIIVSYVSNIVNTQFSKIDFLIHKLSSLNLDKYTMWLWISPYLASSLSTHGCTYENQRNQIAASLLLHLYLTWLHSWQRTPPQRLTKDKCYKIPFVTFCKFTLNKQLSTTASCSRCQQTNESWVAALLLWLRFTNRG